MLTKSETKAVDPELDSVSSSSSTSRPVSPHKQQDTPKQLRFVDDTPPLTRTVSYMEATGKDSDVEDDTIRKTSPPIATTPLLSTSDQPLNAIVESTETMSDSVEIIVTEEGLPMQRNDPTNNNNITTSSSTDSEYKEKANNNNITTSSSTDSEYKEKVCNHVISNKSFKDRIRAKSSLSVPSDTLQGHTDFTPEELALIRMAKTLTTHAPDRCLQPLELRNFHHDVREREHEVKAILSYLSKHHTAIQRNRRKTYVSLKADQTERKRRKTERFERMQNSQSEIGILAQHKPAYQQQ